MLGSRDNPAVSPMCPALTFRRCRLTASPDVALGLCPGLFESRSPRFTKKSVSEARGHCAGSPVLWALVCHWPPCIRHWSKVQNSRWPFSAAPGGGAGTRDTHHVAVETVRCGLSPVQHLPSLQAPPQVVFEALHCQQENLFFVGCKKP